MEYTKDKPWHLQRNNLRRWTSTDDFSQKMPVEILQNSAQPVFPASQLTLTLVLSPQSSLAVLPLLPRAGPLPLPPLFPLLPRAGPLPLPPLFPLPLLFPSHKNQHGVFSQLPLSHPNMTMSSNPSPTRQTPFAAFISIQTHITGMRYAPFSLNKYFLHSLRRWRRTAMTFSVASSNSAMASNIK